MARPLRGPGHQREALDVHHLGQAHLPDPMITSFPFHQAFRRHPWQANSSQACRPRDTRW